MLRLTAVTVSKTLIFVEAVRSPKHTAEDTSSIFGSFAASQDSQLKLQALFEKHGSENSRHFL